MSSRHTRSFFGVMLAVVFAFSAVIAVPASAKLTKHQKAHIRKQLKRAIKKNPRLIRSKSFLKKAALSDFTLPVTQLVIFAVAAIVVGIIAAIFPARRAARLNVLQALQYE